MKAVFATILPGESLRDRVFACVGASLGIGLSGLIAAVATGGSSGVPLLVAPMGASAVLLFALPSSPLAQPWSIIGGNMLSAAIGVTVAILIPNATLAAAVAVALAIGGMSLARCLHPPGGAAALLPVIGGAHVASAGYWFVLMPVGVNAVLLTLLGYCFHLFTRHRYPHSPPVTPASAPGIGQPSPVRSAEFTSADVDAALHDLGETLDVDRDDLERLLRQIEHRARDRARNER